MAYDEALAERIRELVAGEHELTEKQMFGGLAFLIGGNMAVAASGQGGVMVRVDPAMSDELVATTNARPMEMRGRPMQGRLRSSDRHPHPMHWVSPARRRSSSWIRSSIRDVHVRDRRDQSPRVGARPGGSLPSSTAISSRVSPTRCAKTTKAIRRSTARWYRRWPDPDRCDAIRPRCS